MLVITQNENKIKNTRNNRLYGLGKGLFLDHGYSQSLKDRYSHKNKDTLVWSLSQDFVRHDHHDLKSRLYDIFHV